MCHRLLAIGVSAVLAVAFPAPALAQATIEFENTQSAALKWELSYLALSAVDTIQTVECIGSGDCEEVNPLFGKHPSTKKLILAKVGFGAAHFLAFNYINRRNPKGALRFAQASVAVQGTVVALNMRFTFR